MNDMIRICNIQGNQLLSVTITQSCQKVEELMAADYIQLSWNSDLSDELPLGAYIEHNGEKYSLLEPYKPTQKDESEYTYTPKFESRVRAWGKKPFFFYSGQSKEPDWTLTSNPADFMRCVCDAIREETGESWTYSIDASLPASASLSFSSSDILSGLNQIAGAFETEWFADKETNTLYLGLLSHGSEITLEVGKNISVPSVQNSREGYYTRFYAFGSTRNITQDYSGSNTNNLVNKRLTLDPNKYPQGYKDIRGGLSEGEIFSKVLIFDDVYPSAKLSISGVRNRLMYRLDESGNKIQLGTDDSGNPIYDQYTIWYFRIEGFTFDWENVIDGLTPSISFQSGALNGREFEIIYYSEDKKITTSDGIVFEAKQGDYEIKFIEENNLIIPTMTGLVPSDGDEVVLFNIKMPSEYTQSAYVELEEELDKAIARMTSDLSNYSFKSNPVAFNESNPNLSIGRKVRYVNGNYSYSTRVIKLTTQLDFPIEQSISIGNEKVKGNTQQLKEEVASANKDLNLLAVFNEMTQTIQQSYNRTQQMMLDGFAAIKNIWQLRETESGEKYIFSAFDVATQKDFVSFADGKMLDLPSIYDGLPIDGQTIVWEVVDGIEKLVAKGGGTGEGNGTISSIAINGTGNAITSVALNEDKTRLTFIKGMNFITSDYLQEYYWNKTEITDKYYSKLDISNNYYNKFYIDENFITKDGASGLFVTLDETQQDINGVKNFIGELQVNGNPIVYNSAEGYWMLDGDLLVTGDITSFANEGGYTPSSIMDALRVDETNLKVIDGVLTFVGSTGGSGGVAEKVTWANIEGKPTWIGESKPSYSWTEITGKPSWIGSSKPSYSWSEITGKPNFVTEEALDEEGFLTAMDIQVLTFKSGTFKDVSYDPSIAPKIVNIPTKLSHLEDDSDFVTLGMMSSYATKTWVGQQGFLDSSDLNGYATKTWVGQQGFLDSSDLNGYATEKWVGQQGFLDSSDLNGYATEKWVGQQGFATEDWVDENYFSINGGQLHGDLWLRSGTESYGRRIIFGDVRTSNGQPYVYIGEDTDDDLTIASWGDFRIKVGDGAYLTYIKDDGYWEITGDLLVTGGITSYE